MAGLHAFGVCVITVVAMAKCYMDITNYFMSPDCFLSIKYRILSAVALSILYTPG